MEFVSQLTTRQQMFRESLGSRLDLLRQFLRGDQSWRFEAKPYFSVYGKGKVASEGVAGANRHQEIIDFLSDDENRMAIYQFFDAAEIQLEKRVIRVG